MVLGNNARMDHQLGHYDRNILDYGCALDISPFDRKHQGKGQRIFDLYRPYHLYTLNWMYTRVYRKVARL